MNGREWQLRCPLPDGLVAPTRVDATGVLGPTRGQARGPGWRSTGHGWFVPATVPDVPEQRILEAAARLSTGGAVSGWAACRLFGARYFDGLERDGRTRQPVPLVVGPRGGTRAGPAYVVFRDRVDPEEIVLRQGIACVIPHRAVFDAMRWADGVREAVVAYDMAAGADLVSKPDMVRYVEGKANWSGVAQVRSALTLGSERSRSPAETRLRVIWVLDAGLPPPLANWPIADAEGRFLAEVDLLDPVVGLVGEYDGADHRSAARHARDVRREDSLRRVGLEYVTITGRDMVMPQLVADRILAGHARAREIPTDRRSFLIKAVVNQPSRPPD